MAIHIPPVGPLAPLIPKDEHTFTLKELQALVGGYIQILPLHWHDGGGRAFLVLNEDGKHLQLPVNPVATFLLHDSGGAFDDVVVGDAVVCTYSELEGEDDDLDDEAADESRVH